VTVSMDMSNITEFNADVTPLRPRYNLGHSEEGGDMEGEDHDLDTSLPIPRPAPSAGSPEGVHTPSKESVPVYDRSSTLSLSLPPSITSADYSNLAKSTSERNKVRVRPTPPPAHH
jgi:hypothetical protein